MVNNKAPRLKAFTIMEVTIVMLISAIVIGITYTAYSIISKSYVAFKAKNENMAVLARLDQLLRRDFEQATTINNDGKTLMIQKKDGSRTQYIFTDTYIMRNYIVIDTFKVMHTDYGALYEGRLSNSELGVDVPASDGNQLVDELTFKVSFKNELVNYHFYKNYSSENLIKANSDAIN